MTRIVTALLAIAAGASQALVPPGQVLSVQVQGPGAEAHLSRGVQLMQEQLFEAAASEFEQALALNAANPKAHLEFAVCLLSLGRNDEARRQFEQVQNWPANRVTSLTTSGGSTYLPTIMRRPLKGWAR